MGTQGACFFTVSVSRSVCTCGVCLGVQECVPVCVTVWMRMSGLVYTEICYLSLLRELLSACAYTTVRMFVCGVCNV